MAKYVLLAIAALAIVWGIVKRKQVADFWLATKKYLREVKVEMQKVTWPTQNELFGSTIVVLVAVVVLSAIVTAWDQILSFVLHLIIPSGGA
ncbi:preprotein translocase subunit SecE [Candidatus Sumerlaeota bacterium]|nr:preprotein translocase subunit SecE [Candidatus Sumerlaeota bacterium]